MEITNACDFINYAFWWHDVPEGEKYWGDIFNAIRGNTPHPALKVIK
jgi:hypothetical protein